MKRKEVQKLSIFLQVKLMSQLLSFGEIATKYDKIDHDTITPPVSSFLFFLSPSPLPVQICHPSGAAIVGELIKNSLVVVVDNCGHAMPVDRPRKCAKLVYQFINKLDSGLDLISD